MCIVDVEDSSSEIHEDVAEESVVSAASEANLLATVRARLTRDQSEHVDCQLAPNAARVSLKGVNDLNCEVQARRAIVPGTLELMKAGNKAEHFHPKAVYASMDIQFPKPKMRTSARDFWEKAPALIQAYESQAVEVRMKLWTTSGMCSVRLNTVT